MANDANLNPPPNNNSETPGVTLDDLWGASDQEAAQKSLQKVFKILVGLMVGLYCLVAGLFSFWVLVQPNSPDFGLTSGRFYDFNLTGPELSANWAFEFSAHNPNKAHQAFNYQRLVASVSYDRDYALAEAQLRPFIQPGKNWTTIPAQLVTVAQFLNDDVNKKMAADKSRGIIEVEVEVEADIRFESVFIKRPTRWQAVYCNRVKFEFLSGVNGTMVDSHPHRCKASNQRAVMLFLVWFLVFFFFLFLFTVVFM